MHKHIDITKKKKYIDFVLKIWHIRAPPANICTNTSANIFFGDLCEIVENALLARRDGTEPKRHELKPNRTTRQHHLGNITQMSSARCNRLEMTGYYSYNKY